MSLYSTTDLRHCVGGEWVVGAEGHTHTHTHTDLKAGPEHA